MCNMDRSKSPSKPTMSFPTIKYKVNQDELEEIYLATDLDKSLNLDNSESTDKSKKSDKAGLSILDKYLKAFKADKNPDEEPKSEKDISDKKGSDLSEVSGSPIKEYFSKFQKRSDSVENSDVTETARDLKDKDLRDRERWKLFNDIKVKFAQAVEDIKSSRTNEDGKEKQSSIEETSDSEENSLQQELDPSMASTENQVSSISSSNQNLSDLSLPLSHSSTITDNEMDTNSSSENNPLNATPTTDKKDKVNTPVHEPASKNVNKIDELSDEIESGVDVLEDFELSKNDPSIDNDEVDVTTSKNTLKIIERRMDTNIPTNTFFTFSFTIFSAFVLSLFYLFPAFLMLNGIFVGMWLSTFLHKVYISILDYFGFGQEPNYDKLKMIDSRNFMISKVPQIIEFEPLKKYEGWVNLYSYKKYDPMLYHVSLTNTVYVKLEGSRLRLSYTSSKIPKRAMHNEKEHNVTFYEHKVFDLDGSQISLLPVGIVKKRHWSKKYPICITIHDRRKMTVLSHVQSDQPETIGSPEKSSPRKNKDISTGETSSSTKVITKAKDVKQGDEKVEKNNTEKSDLETSQEVSKQETPKKTSTPAKEKVLVEDAKERKSKSKVRHFYMDDFISDDSDDENVFRDPSLENFQDVMNADVPRVKLDDTETSNNNNNDNTVTDFILTDNKTDVPETEYINLYIFCRTDREKSEWFRRLKSAIDEIKSQRHASESSQENATDEKVDTNETSRSEATDGERESKARLGVVKGDKKAQDGSDTSVLWTPGGNHQAAESLLSESFVPVQDVDFWKHMKSIIEKKNFPKTDPDTGDPDKYLWLNALLGRVAFDTFRNPVWVMSLQERIQKKLSSIKLPSFMSPLIVTNLDLGHESPLILDASAPKLDACGVWVDLQMVYSGKANMTLATQLNLMSLKDRKDTVSSEESQEEQKPNQKAAPSYSRRVNMAVFDSDLEDTAESSSEDETYNLSTSQMIPVENLDNPQQNVGNTPAKKLLRFVDKIAANKYFQHVTDYKYVKRAMEGVSKTDLKLNVELCELVGCFTINIPPSPSDRLWFGFRGPPRLMIKAKPIFGSRVLNFGHATSWIEKRLISEFEKILVYPNLEDIIIDSMLPPPH